MYGITRGLVERFGPDRVIDTPLAGTAIAGAAIGAALLRMRPVAKIHFADFLTAALDQIVNMVANIFPGPGAGGDPGASRSGRCRRTIVSGFFELLLEWQLEYLPVLDWWFVLEHEPAVRALAAEVE